MGTESAIRASYGHKSIETIQKHPEANAILARIPEESLELLRGKSSLAWFPFEHYLNIVQAIDDVIGSKEAADLWRAISLASYGGAVLKDAVKMVRRLFGLTPGSLGSQAGRYWPYFIRHAGTIAKEARGPQEFYLRVHDFPSQFMTPAFMSGLAGVFSAYFPLCEVEGTADLVDPQPWSSSLTIRIQWGS